MSDLIVYTSEDGQTRMQLRSDGKTVRLTQLEIAELFQTTKQNVSLHAKSIFNDGELSSDSVVKDSLTTATDGKRYRTQFYNLDLILAIGYRVRSPRGTQFRQWATAHLREFIVKGFVMEDERFKNPGGWDYFDELLARRLRKRQAGRIQRHAAEKIFVRRCRRFQGIAGGSDGDCLKIGARRFRAFATTNRMGRVMSAEASPASSRQFGIALPFPGEHRDYVRQVAEDGLL